MGDKTGISWTDATWNCVRGCSRVSPGCARCYAEVQAARIVRMGKGKPTAYDGLVRVTAGGEPRWTGVVQFVREQLAWPLRKKKPLRIFVNSMSDLFHEELTNEEIAAVFGVMAACPQHTFQVLTKRAKRMREWFAWAREEALQCGEGDGTDYGLMLAGFAGVELGDGSAGDESEQQEAIGARIADSWARPGADGGTVWDLPWPLRNVWIGVSVENQEAADERIPELLRTPAAVRFLSCEPLLGPVSLALPHTWLVGATARKILCDHGARGPVPAHLAPPPSLDWVIAGCESGPGARPCAVEWLRALRDQCASAGIAFFLKQAVEQKDHQESFIVADRNGSKRKPGNVIELPYLDGVQHADFPTGGQREATDR